MSHASLLELQRSLQVLIWYSLEICQLFKCNKKFLVIANIGGYFVFFYCFFTVIKIMLFTTIL